MERCRNCGKPIVSFGDMGIRWTHDEGGIFRKYCFDVRTNPKTWDVNRVAEPPTKNEIVYAILKDL